MIQFNIFKISLTIGLIFIFQQFSLAQAGASGIKGKVIEASSGEAIPFANVSIYNNSDSSLVTGAASDIDGNFDISVKEGSYYIRLSFLSFRSKNIPNIVVQKNQKNNVGNLTMVEDAKLLQEVEITAERSQMELKLDKRVFNVNQDLANVGANAAEILDNLPSVEVDVEGNVSLRGSENVRVLIDGKPSTMVAGNIGEALRQFQGGMIERVEIITNPSARYEAEGEVGIINIVLKKEKQRGVNGSIELAGGYPELYRGSFNLNYRTKFINIFASAGSSYNNAPGSSTSFQEFRSLDTAYQYESITNRRHKDLSHNFRIGTDLYLNDHNTLTLSGFYRKSGMKNTSDLTYKDLDDNENVFQEVNRMDTKDNGRRSFEYALNYYKTFEKENQTFTADLKWSENTNDETSDIDEINYLTMDNLLQKTNVNSGNKEYLFQADYVHPIGKDGRFETGIRGGLRTINSDFMVMEQAAGNTSFTNLSDFQYDFLYQEDIYAAYAMFGDKLDKFTYQIGVRGEYSDVSTELKDAALKEDDNHKKYIDFFPSLHLTYKLNNEDDLQLSYSRRISRPFYRSLLPISNFTDERSFWRGNPNILPEYTDSYEAGYLRYFEKGSIFSSIYYRHRNQVVERITLTDSNGVSSRFPINLATENNFGLELNGTYNFGRRNTLTANFNFYRSIREGNYEGLALKSDVYTWNSKVSYKVRLPYEVDMQASIFYRAPRKNTQGSTKAMYAGDLSFAKDILKGNGTLVFSVRDLLNTRRWRSETETETDLMYYYSNSEFQWRERQFVLSFTYRINRQKPKGPTRPMGGDGDFEEMGM